MIFYSLTIFLSAFLLFLVQLLIARHILPWYGGGPGVWATCMVFFQLALLVGYTYAHWLSGKIGPRQQAIVHIVLLVISLPFLIIAPDAAWKPTGIEAPIGNILLLLAAHVGLPFGILSSTSPLLMSWFSQEFPKRHPYRLYALSNFGSFLALISYPFVIAPALSLEFQEHLWSLGYALFVLCCGVCAFRFRRCTLKQSTARQSAPTKTDDEILPGRADTFLWLILSATGSVLLLATTNQMCTDLAVVPLLWVLPLAIYLLSFVICFDRERWYHRGLFFPLFAVSSCAVTYLMLANRPFSLGIPIAVFSVALFAGTMICHGELVRLKPVPHYLTRFYLAVAAGGALGGVFVAIVAPLIFPDYWEFPLGIVATGSLAMFCLRRSQTQPTRGNLPRLGWAGGILVFAAVAGGLIWDRADMLSRALETSRSFFGVIRIRESDYLGDKVRSMQHGRTKHGAQFLSEAKHEIPTTYYGWDSGVGIALERYRALIGDQQGLRVGIIGLGAGTISSYAQPGDLFRFYEIDPEVEHLARKHFSFLSDSPATTEVVIGDARVVLEREAEQGSLEFDLLIIDAFNSDAVPMHLLTREAYQVYRSHLKPGGLLAFHVSNGYLDLAAVVRGLVEDAGEQSVRIISTINYPWNTEEARWVIATDNTAFLNDPQVLLNANAWLDQEMQPLLWTDDFGSLWSAATKSRIPSKWASAPNAGHFVSDRGGLITGKDAYHIEEISRRLYADSRGKITLMVGTVESMAAAGVAPGTGMETFAEQFYLGSGIVRSDEDFGVMIIVSRDDKRATIHLGRSWPKGAIQAIRQIFKETAAEGLKQGEGSQGITKCIEQIDQFVRSQQTAK